VGRLVPYLATAPLVGGVGLVLWLTTDFAAVRVVTPFAILAAGIVGFGLGRNRPSGRADLVSLVGVGLVVLAVLCVPFVTRPLGQVGFPLFGVLGVGTAAYGVGHRSDEGWALTRDLGDGGDDGEYRPWLDEAPDWAADDRRTRTVEREHECEDGTREREREHEHECERE